MPVAALSCFEGAPSDGPSCAAIKRASGVQASASPPRVCLCGPNAQLALAGSLRHESPIAQSRQLGPLVGSRAQQRCRWITRHLLHQV